jgi:hypothetical protein
MSTIQGEMEDIIQGFTQAWRSVTGSGKTDIDPPTPSNSESHPVPEEPEVSILPIDTEPQSPSDDPVSSSPPPPEVKKTDPDAFIGRGAEEVKAAFERAGADVHVEL